MKDLFSYLGVKLAQIQKLTIFNFVDKPTDGSQFFLSFADKLGSPADRSFSVAVLSSNKVLSINSGSYK